jgi:hypothetical protein
MSWPVAWGLLGAALGVALLAVTIAAALIDIIDPSE